ncbi:MAG: hypothetical protein AAB495_03660 [Patescibacteria group bacterium]
MRLLLAPRKLDVFDLVTSGVVYYASAYLFPLVVFFHLPTKYFDFSSAAWSPATLLYVTGGLLAFLVGSVTAPRGTVRWVLGATKFIARPWSPGRRTIVYAGSAVATVLFCAVWLWGGSYFHLDPQGVGKIGVRFYSLIGSLRWLFLVTLLVLTFERFFTALREGGKEVSRLRIIAWTLLLAAACYGFFSASRYSVLFPFFSYMIVRHYYWRKYMIRDIASIALLVMVGMALINIYKEPNIWLTSYRPNNASRTIAATQYVVDNSIGRISPYAVLEKIFTPHKEYRGTTPANFLINIAIPRILWKEKPVMSPDGNAFGRALGILQPDDYRTTVAPTMMGDFYLGFGLWGMFFAMFCLGFVFRVLARVFLGGGGASPTGILVYVVLWLQLVKGMEDWASPVFAGTIKMIAILLIVHLFAMKRMVPATPATS